MIERVCGLHMQTFYFFNKVQASDMVQDIGKVQKLVVDEKSLSRVNLLR